MNITSLAQTNIKIKKGKKNETWSCNKALCDVCMSVYLYNLSGL